MLIQNYDQRQLRIQEKRLKVLGFLRQETYSSPANIQKVMGVTTPHAARKTLKQYEAEGLVRRSEFSFEGARIYLWGITPHGIALSFGESEDYEEYPHFDPSRLSLTTVPHHLDTQRIRLELEGKDWTSWQTCDRGEFLRRTKAAHRPDGIITSPTSEMIAIEVERTIKTKKRYQQIITAHLKDIKAGHWKEVYYFLPSNTLRQALSRIFASISYVVINGQRVQLEERHKAVFKFYTYDEVKEL